MNLSEESEWLSAVTSFKATNTVFSITDEYNRISITIPSHLQTKSAEKTINEPTKLSVLRSEKGIRLHMKEVRKRGNQIKIGD